MLHSGTGANTKENCSKQPFKRSRSASVHSGSRRSPFWYMVSSGSKKMPPRTPRTLQNAPPDCLRDVISPGQWRTAVQRYAELRRTAIHRERPTPPTSAIHRARPTTTPSTSATIFYEMIITVSSPIRAGQVAGPQLAGVEAS